MADEDLTLNEDQLLENLDEVNGESELLNEVSELAIAVKCFTTAAF